MVTGLRPFLEIKIFIKLGENTMKKNFLSLLVLASILYVMEPKNLYSNELSGYLEGQFSRIQVEDVDASTSVASGGFNVAATATAEYEEALGLGLEAGISNLGNSGFRLGLSLTSFEAELEAIDVSAALSFNGTVLASARGRVTADELRNVGVDADNEVKLFLANGYYDFKSESKLIPFIGLGVGYADIEYAKDNEMAFAGHGGFNYALSENTYAGLRGSYYQIEGPTDSLGIQYDDVKAWSIGLSIGMKF